MTVSKSSGNMYPKFFCEFCWSPLVGGCGHQCPYCYAKRMYEKYSKNRKWGDRPHWVSENWKLLPIANCFVWKGLPKLPKGKIFVCHTTDLFAENIPDDWIKEILNHCNKFPESEFIFQTKNPKRYFDYLDLIPKGSWLGTTIETSKNYFEDYGWYDDEISKAPIPFIRFEFMRSLKIKHLDYKYFITIEPIMKFDNNLTYWIEMIKPDLIFIGCDSGKNNLPEPTRGELIELIEQLNTITHVHIKSNCKRILGDMTLHNWFEAIKKM